jgi:hypothetical protein
MKKLIIFASLLIAVSCQKREKSETVATINGYADMASTQTSPLSMEDSLKLQRHIEFNEWTIREKAKDSLLPPDSLDLRIRAEILDSIIDVKSGEYFNRWLADTLKHISKYNGPKYSVQKIEMSKDSFQMFLYRYYDLTISPSKRIDYPDNIEAVLNRLKQYGELPKKSFQLHLVVMYWYWPSTFLYDYTFQERFEEITVYYNNDSIHYSLIHGNLDRFEK